MSGGNIPRNPMTACETALKQGADMNRDRLADDAERLVQANGQISEKRNQIISTEKDRSALHSKTGRVAVFALTFRRFFGKIISV